MPIRYLKHRIFSIYSITASLIGFCFLQSSALYAADYQYLIEATARAEYIDNPRLGGSFGGQAQDDQDELLLMQRLGANLSRATSKLVTNVDYQASKYSYRENLLFDRTLITGSSSIDWMISPERLSWNLSNRRSLQVVDPLLPDTLNNRQVINMTSTGPSVTFQLGGRNKLAGSAIYSIADYEVSGLPRQDRIMADLLFSHNFTTRFISSLGGNYLQSEFDGAPIFDFDRYQYFWQNEYATEIFNVNVRLGQNVLSRQNFDDQENILVRLTGSYKINSQSTVDFNYSDSYEDIFSNTNMLGTQFSRITPITPVEPIGDRLGNSNLNQNFQLVQKGIGYTYTRSEFFNINFRYTEAERDYQLLQSNLNPGEQDPNNPNPGEQDPSIPDPNNRDQSDNTFHVGANWTLFQNLNLNIYGRYTEQEFSNIDREQERNEYGLQAGYRISKSLYAQFGASKVNQDGNFLIDNYDGFNYWLSLTLSIGNQ